MQLPHQWSLRSCPLHALISLRVRAVASHPRHGEMFLAAVRVDMPAAPVEQHLRAQGFAECSGSRELSSDLSRVGNPRTCRHQTRRETAYSRALSQPTHCLVQPVLICCKLQSFGHALMAVITSPSPVTISPCEQLGNTVPDRSPASRTISTRSPATTAQTKPHPSPGARPTRLLRDLPHGCLIYQKTSSDYSYISHTTSLTLEGRRSLEAHLHISTLVFRAANYARVVRQKSGHLRCLRRHIIAQPVPAPLPLLILVPKRLPGVISGACYTCY